jgi:hypothetical protein
MDAGIPIPLDTDPVLPFPAIEQPFIGRWNQLVSNTNWEKGRIIHEWRTAVAAADAPATEFSDEAWSRRVGGVSSQHVGRLRRVFQRFAATRDHYRGLYWSHFQAALDWDDAEMWLEGSAQNSWSVAVMRRTRWETLNQVAGGQAALLETDDPSERDEDFVPEPGEREGGTDGQVAYAGRIVGPIPEGPDFGDEYSSSPDSNRTPAVPTDHSPATAEVVQPFERLAELPADFAEAFDAMKLSVLRHKSEGWRQITRDDLFAALDALKQLALAP